MAIFCPKKLNSPIRAGEILKKKRQELKLSLKEISLSTLISEKYLLAIEKGNFEHFPQAKALCVAYFKKYATFLNLNHSDYLSQFISEANLNKKHAFHPLGHLKIKPLNSIVWWLKTITLIILITCFIGYLIWQINGILSPPKLVIYTPFEGYVTNHLSTMIQGETDKEIKLTINGKEVMTNNQGQFEIMLDLPKGVNTITISATKKHGKTTTIIRHIIVKDNKGY